MWGKTPPRGRLTPHIGGRLTPTACVLRRRACNFFRVRDMHAALHTRETTNVAMQARCVHTGFVTYLRVIPVHPYCIFYMFFTPKPQCCVLTVDFVARRFFCLLCIRNLCICLWPQDKKLWFIGSEVSKGGRPNLRGRLTPHDSNALSTSKSCNPMAFVEQGPPFKVGVTMASKWFGDSCA